MKISRITVKKFKRFTDLTICNLPISAKLVILVGPNGSGKTSVFEALNHWHMYKGFHNLGNPDFYFKIGIDDTLADKNSWYNNVSVDFHDVNMKSNAEIQGKFYFRSAYRNEPDFTVSQLTQQQDPTKQVRLQTLMSNDVTVSENYQRLISQTLSCVFNKDNNLKTVEQLREELVGKIQVSLKNVFEDLTLSSIGDPLANGSFYFEKGFSKDFHYKNLSAGEKSAFDMF